VSAGLLRSHFNLLHWKTHTANFYSNDTIFTKAIVNLLFILSEWTGSEINRREQGLILELGAYSPSDCKHMSRNFHLEDDTDFEACSLQSEKLRLDKVT